MSVSESGTHSVVIDPAGNLRGSVRLPGDKSISHRYAMLAGMAEGLDFAAGVPDGEL